MSADSSTEPTEAEAPVAQARAAAPPPRRRIRVTRAQIRDLFTLRLEKSAVRVGVVGIAFLGLFGVIGGRLVAIALAPEATGGIRHATASAIAAARPDILDRNGETLATDVKTVSVFADPRKIGDKDEAVELLTAVLPDLDARELRERLGQRRGFVWIKREITPRQQAEVHRLGIPSVGFLPENKRVYPNGVAAAHVLGFANIDNVGIAGMEKYIDSQGLQDLNGAGFTVRSEDLKPVALSIDLRSRHALRDELARPWRIIGPRATPAWSSTSKRARSRALDSLATTSTQQSRRMPWRIPIQPNQRGRVRDWYRPSRLSRSPWRSTRAIQHQLDLRRPGQAALRPLRHARLHDAQNRVLNVARGVSCTPPTSAPTRWRWVLGVEATGTSCASSASSTAMQTSCPRAPRRVLPPRWGELNTMTIAFGHGLAVAPLQAVMATAALVNGGNLITPTFLKRTPEEALAIAKRVVKPETSEAMRYVLRLNAEKGSATRAAIAGFYVGGKTGTAEKVINGRYSKEKKLTTFMAVAPADKPRYLFLTIIDEPQPTPDSHGYSTSGWNAAPTTGNVIERVDRCSASRRGSKRPKNHFPLCPDLVHGERAERVFPGTRTRPHGHPSPDHPWRTVSRRAGA
jgi:cell division protein FtsI (penicillin-binding protein 3)